MPRAYVKRSGARKAHCGYKYNKKTKAWRYATKKGESCMPGKGSIKRHNKISMRAVGGMMGHFGRLRRERSDRGKANAGFLSHSQKRGVRMNRAAGANKGHTRF